MTKLYSMTARLAAEKARQEEETRIAAQNAREEEERSSWNL